MVFIDASSNMEEHNLRVFMICTHSVTGALPLGLVITSDEKTETLIAAFEMYKESLPDGSFFGKGMEGPSIFMTDNCPEERDALSMVWPNATLILCTFHILQQVWRWLHDSKHQIEKYDRPSLLSKFKSLVYAETANQFEEVYRKVLDEVNYSSYGDYLKSLHNYKESWALCYRKDLITRGNNTNNNAEAQFLVIKDIILQRVKEYNINALFDKLTTDLNTHYKNKLLSVASGSFDGFYSARFTGKTKKKGGMGFNKPSGIEFAKMKDGIVDYSNNIFTVPSVNSPSECYLVDLSANTCACLIGANGAPCKHQYVLWVLNKGNEHNFLPVFSKLERKRFAEIAIGDSLPDEFYESLHENTLVLDSVVNDQNISFDNTLTETGPLILEDQMEKTDREETKRTIAINALDEAFANLRSKIESGDCSLLDGIDKFNCRLKKMSSGQLASALHTFGSQQFRSKRVTSTVTSLVKRSQKYKIGVQPESVKRRTVKKGTKRALRKGRPSKPISCELPVKAPATKRKHEFSHNVCNNEPVAKKAGRSMMSKSKVVTEAGKKKKTISNECLK